MPSVTEAFPLSLNDCSDKLLRQSITVETSDPPEKCKMAKVLKEANVKTWFTFPLHESDNFLGFCIVGFLNYVPLLNMSASFIEFGKDLTVAMTMARQKNSQLKKFEGIEWISMNLSLNAPIEKHIEEITSRAGQTTNADFACIFLYNERESCFELQVPSYGKIDRPQKIMIEENYILSNYFPCLEKTGGTQLTIPLIIDLKTIGVLHIENQKPDIFTGNDLKVLELLSNHIATIMENARLFNNEKEQKNRLQFLLDYQQELVKETVEVENFDGITSMLSKLFHNPVILYDRFMRPISFSTEENINLDLLQQLISKNANKEKSHFKSADFFTIEDPDDASNFFLFWMINGGGSLLGYLGLKRSHQDLDEIDRLSIELARNICSIQFIKQKIILDAKEQAMDSFINKLLAKDIEDKDGIMQYANLFQWDLFQPHQLAVLSISLTETEIQNSNLFEQHSKKNLVWEYIKSQLVKFDRNILTAYRGDENILIVPFKNEGDLPKKFWQTLYSKIVNWANQTAVHCNVYIGAGGKTGEINDYYVSYKQATEALSILKSRPGQWGISLFDELGSYEILHHLNNLTAVELFVRKQIGPLLFHSEEKKTDLGTTLHTFLHNNGNVKSTADELYIHRSSLLYRLEKIESLLEISLNDPEVRFNLMLAFKLFEMYGQEIEKSKIFH
jgi:DNA-binding PucR family transcriptional regulator